MVRRSMSYAVQCPISGCAVRYQGIFRPHWEIAHIAVRVPRSGKLATSASTLTVMIMLLGLSLLNPLFLLVFGSFTIFLLVVPAKECWAMSFSPTARNDFQNAPEDIDLFIEFEGVVSPLGRYGHKGMMHREVNILRVFRYSRVKNGIMI